MNQEPNAAPTENVEQPAMNTPTRDTTLANLRPPGANWLHRLVQRFRSWQIRRRKARKMLDWLTRWDAACRRSWQILSDGPATRERFERWERNQNRLLRLIESKRR